MAPVEPLGAKRKQRRCQGPRLREAGLGGVGEQSGRGSEWMCREGRGGAGRRIVKLLCPSHRMRNLLTRATRREMSDAGETICEEEEAE